MHYVHYRYRKKSIICHKNKKTNTVSGVLVKLPSMLSFPNTGGSILSKTAFSTIVHGFEALEHYGSEKFF